MENEQTGAKEGSSGTTDNLLIDETLEHLNAIVTGVI